MQSKLTVIIQVQGERNQVVGGQCMYASFVIKGNLFCQHKGLALMSYFSIMVQFLVEIFSVLNKEVYTCMFEWSFMKIIFWEIWPKILIEQRL